MNVTKWSINRLGETHLFITATWTSTDNLYLQYYPSETGYQSTFQIHLGDHDKSQIDARELILKPEYLVFRPDRFYFDENAYLNYGKNGAAADIGKIKIINTLK